MLILFSLACYEGALHQITNLKYSSYDLAE